MTEKFRDAKEENMMTISIDGLICKPEENGLTKVVHCDRCGGKLYCKPDFDPPSCMTCNPEMWGKPE